MMTKELKPYMEKAYLEYALSVITDRALPDVRDGLKPVQRRILYGAQDMKLSHSERFRKSAALVGHVMGAYHPHGDSAIYEAACGLIQDFNTRYPLLEGQGNFGSIDSESPAASRYTELRMSKFGELMTDSVENGTVPMIKNFDGEHLEPSVLPSKFPNLIVNGTSGIAVAMSTNMPPHNFGEVVEALSLIAKKDASEEEILRVMPGPDFPLGGVIEDSSGILEYYKTGIGSFSVSSKWSWEKVRGHLQVVISEIPYRTNKAKIVEKIGEIIEKNLFPGLLTVNDESNLDGIRIVIHMAKDVDVTKAMRFLFQKTSLAQNYHVKNLVLDENGKPKVFPMKKLLGSYLAHQIKVYQKEAASEMEVLQKKILVTKALLKAVSKIHDVVSLLEKGHGEKEVSEKLKKMLGVSEEGVAAILSLRLRQIQKMEKEKLEKDLLLFQKDFDEKEKRVKDKKYLLSVILSFLKKTASLYGDARRTQIGEKHPPKEQTFPVTLFLTPKEIVMVQKKEIPKGSFAGTAANLGDDFLFFSADGIVEVTSGYSLKMPMERENVSFLLSFSSEGEKENLYLFTEKGMAKAISKDVFTYAMEKKKKFSVLSLEPGDRLLAGFFAKPEESVICQSSGKKFIHANLLDVRPMGLSAKGVVFMKMKESEKISSVFPVRDAQKLCFLKGKKVTEENLANFPPQKRAGLGRGMRGYEYVLPACHGKYIIFGTKPYVIL